MQNFFPEFEEIQFCISAPLEFKLMLGIVTYFLKGLFIFYFISKIARNRVIYIVSKID